MTKQKFDHLPVHPETKADVDEIGLKLAQKRKKKSVSYNSIIKYLIELEKKKAKQK